MLKRTVVVLAHVGVREKSWYLIAMMGVSRAKIPGIAAVNERALALVLETMHTERAD